MNFVFGEYHYNMDNKGRVIMPPNFRDFLGETFMITRGLDGCLFVFPTAEWEKIVNKLNGLPITDPAVRKFTRFFFASAVKCLPDKQGRVTIPPSLRDHAKLEKEAVIVGMNRRVEIWSETGWLENMAVDPEEFAGRMAELGI